METLSPPASLRSDGLGHANRKFADALAGRSENRIGHCRGCTRHARLPDPAGFLVAPHHMHFNLWSFIDPQHRIVVKIALLHASLVKRQFIVQRRSDAEYCSALHLRLDDSGVHVPTAVHRANHTMHAHFTVFIHRSFRHVRGETAERSVHCNPSSPPCRQRLAPVPLFRNDVEHAAFPWTLPQQRAPHLIWILAARRAKLIEKTFLHECRVRMAHRPPPQHRHSIFRRMVLHINIRNRIRHIRRAFHRSFINAVLDQHRKRRAVNNGLPHDMLRPRQRRALRIHTASKSVVIRRPVIAAAHVVFARPYHFHRRPDSAVVCRSPVFSAPPPPRLLRHVPPRPQNPRKDWHAARSPRRAAWYESALAQASSRKFALQPSCRRFGTAFPSKSRNGLHADPPRN